jgi:hypothetical protein
MTWIFEIEDKSGRKIHLSDERWKHLNQDHPEVAPFLEDIKEMLSLVQITRVMIQNL